MEAFQMLTDESMASIINNASNRVVYVAPGIWSTVAEAISAYQKRRKAAALEVVLDPDPQVCRLGYGELVGIKHLNSENIRVRKCAGIRIGLLIADEKAWCFSLAPRLIEEEPTGKSAFAPNSIVIGLEQANELLNAVAPQLVFDQKPAAISGNKPPIVAVPTPEIARETFGALDFQELEADLNERPPQQFDLARLVNVYSTYVQFVELSLEGTHLTRHTVSIPQELLRWVSDEKDKDRLKASYQLIRPESDLSGKVIHEKVKRLRDKYLKSLGNRYGVVILKQYKEDFISELNQLQHELNCFRKTVRSRLSEEFETCKRNLQAILGPLIKNNPPDDLKYGITTPKLEDSTISEFLEEKLKPVIPKPDSFVTDMAIRCHFKDVTYEMLHDRDFAANLRKAYPFASFPEIPINEYRAAPIREPQ